METRPGHAIAARVLGGALAVALLAGFAGCATPQVAPPTLTADAGATRFEARSLNDPGLRQYLQANLGHEPERWNFDALCWVGFYYQPALELARAQWATAKAAEVIAAQKTNPTLTLTPGYDTTHQAGISPWMPSAGLDYLWSTAGKRRHETDAARADAEAARLGIISQAWQLRSDLRKALNDALAASRRQATLHAQADAQHRVLTLLEQRFAAGAIAEPDLAPARNAALRADAATVEAETQVATARARVAAVLGIPMRALEDVALPEPPLPSRWSTEALESARRQSLRTRADVLAALAKYESAQASLELELAKRIPDIHLGPGYQWDQGLNKWSLGISIELPVFHGNEAAVAQAVSRRAEAAAQFNVVQGQAVAAIDTAITTWQAAAAQLQRARKLQAEAQRQTQLARQRREAGAADALEVDTAELDAATAQSAVSDAELAAASAAGQLEDALQIPFADLDAVTRETPALVQP